MQVPVQVSFRGFEPAENLEPLVRERAADLERYFDNITACRVMVEKPHHHHAKGQPVHVRVDLTIPGAELVVHHDGPAQAQDHPEAAVREAFKEARRRLQGEVQRMRGEVKRHAT